MSLQAGLDAGTEISRYRIEELVARGGMGLVYRARDIRLERRVALKVLSPELSEDINFRNRFVRESRLAAAVDHPHVIPVYEADDWNGLLYIAMRFVQGVDLHTVLATGGALDTRTALMLLGQAASALDAAHEAGLVHRDVKPGNFMLAGATAERVPPTTHVYLTDFGLTKRATSVSGLTRTGQFLGSLHYVAPEQIRGEDVDARTDVYALTCVAFELLAGEPPFEREQDAALLWAHMSEPPPLLSVVRPDLPEDVADVLTAGMAKQRDERPSTCGELVDSLRSAVGGPAVVGPPHAVGPTARVAPGDAGGPGPEAGGRVATPPQFAPPAPPPLVPTPAPSTVQQRQDTPLALSGPPADVATGSGPPPWSGVAAQGAGAGSVPPAWPGGPPPGGPPGAAPPWAGPPWGPVAGTPQLPPRKRRRWWLIPAAAVLVVLGVLFLWRPWSTSLTTRDLVVVPYKADVPSDWSVFTATGDVPYAVVGSRDWTKLIASEDSAVSDAENAASDDPDSLAYLYVDNSSGVSASTAQEAADQVEAGLPSGSAIVGHGTRQVAGRQAFVVGGVLPLGDSQQLRLLGIVINEDPHALLIFIAPASVYDKWAPTFEDVIDSVSFTG